MPLFKLTPVAEAVSVQGVEFRANDRGLFELPANPIIQAALTAHGFTLEEIEALEQEPGFASQEDIVAERDAEIAALKAQIAELQAKPLPAARKTETTPAEPPKPEAKPAGKPDGKPADAPKPDAKPAHAPKSGA